MRVFGALILSVVVVGLVSAEHLNECCRKISRTRIFEETSLRTRKNRPFCTINRYLCSTTKNTDYESNLKLLNELYSRWNARTPNVPEEATFEILRSLASIGKFRRENNLCNVRSLYIIINDLPEFKKQFSNGDALADSQRLANIFDLIAEEHAAKCPEIYMERFKFFKKTFNKTFMDYILATIDRIITSQLAIGSGGGGGGGGHSNTYTREDYMRSGRLVHFGSQPTAKLLIDGLRSVGDEPTVKYLHHRQQQQQSSDNKQPPANNDEQAQQVSFRSINNIIRRYVVKPCGYFINHFKVVFPSLRRAEFETFRRLLEPRGDHQSEYYHYWIIYDACRAFNHELQTYFNKITKFVVAEFNGYGNFQELEATRKEDWQQVEADEPAKQTEESKHQI